MFVNDFDHDVAGVYFIGAFRQASMGTLSLNWIYQELPSYSSKVIDDIEDGKAWASVYINAGTTEQLNSVVQAIITGDTSNISYRPSSAVTVVYDEGRNVATVDGSVLPVIRAVIAGASAAYAAYMQAQFVALSNTTLSNGTVPNATSANVAAAIKLVDITYSPLGFTPVNLHPAFPYARIWTVALAYLFLWLITIPLVALNIRVLRPLEGHVKVLDIVLLRLFSTIFHSLIFALIFSLCVLWMAEFTRAVPFIRFWLLNWISTVVFTIIVALYTRKTNEIAQLILTVFLVLNFSATTDLIAIELQNPFFRIGYALPLYHSITAASHFLYGSHTKLGVNFGALIAYCVALIILSFIPVFVQLCRRRTKQPKQLGKRAATAEKSRNTLMK